MASTSNSNSSESAPLTPRIKAGKTLFESAKGDLRSAQSKLDSARAIRRAARRAA
jgi:hypothetical protein